MRPNEYNDLLIKIKCSDEFRDRMQKKLSSEPVKITETEYADSVSGTEIAPQRSWGRVAAMAAAFVLVFGAIGGGVYHFYKMKDKPVINEEIGDSIYDTVKANKDVFDMDEYVWNQTGGPSVLVTNSGKHKDELFDYLDKLEGIEKVDTCKDSNRIVSFSFDDKNGGRYDLDIYENGYGLWMKSKGIDIEKQENYYFGANVFEDLLNMVIKDADSDINEYVKMASEEEIENLIWSQFLSQDITTATFMPDLRMNSNLGDEEYIILDKEGIADIIRGFEWEKVTISEFDYSNCYSMGIILSESGYLKSGEESIYGNYRIKDEVQAVKFKELIGGYMDSKSESRDVTSEEIKAIFKNIADNPTVSSWDGRLGCPQGRQYYDTICRKYNINDTESFINEVASLEWVTCSNSEIDENTISDKAANISVGSFTIAKSVHMFRNGYLNGGIKCYKLKNESDIDALTAIYNKYFIMTEASQLAEKICNGIDNYDNLNADFVFEQDHVDGEVTSFDGHMSLDAKNHKMYMSGYGKYNGEDVTLEIVMEDEDRSAYRIIDKATNSTDRELLHSYGYSSVMIYMPDCHYTYLCKTLEKDLTPIWQDPDINIESRDLGDGITEYNFILSNQDETKGYTIVLTERGQLLSYETNTEKFRLENYVFDSDSFSINGNKAIFEDICYEENKISFGLPENSLYPEFVANILYMDINVTRDDTSFKTYSLIDIFKILDREGGDEDFWMLHGSSFKKDSKYGDRHMDGYYTVTFDCEYYEFVLYIPDDESKNEPEWGDDTILIEKYYGTDNKCTSSYFRYFSKDDIKELTQTIKNAKNNKY